ncbi:MAG: hypothetical protein CM15mP73_1690 [Hyphomicrobiales bacterium]|nr:MAG: hypothetical protein CM15mP73_1690 [Hyphomicrobiales bacterium]
MSRAKRSELIDKQINHETDRTIIYQSKRIKCGCWGVHSGDVRFMGFSEQIKTLQKHNIDFQKSLVSRLCRGGSAVEN